MATYSANEFRNGLKLIIDGDPYVIIESDFVKPGKGQAFTRSRVKNLKTGRVVDKTWRASESEEGADVVDMDMEYLYSDGEFWHFMEPNSFEQYAVSETAMGDTAKWIKGQEMCTVTLWNDAPLTVSAPNFVELTITETDPGLRGDTASGGTKPAHLETGAVVKVPLFMEEGEVLRIDTRTGEYVGRVKD